MNTYINPYSDTFTLRLLRAKEKREKLKEAEANDVVLSRRSIGLQFSTISADSSCLHSSRKTFVARPLSACRARSSSINSTLFRDDGEILTRNRSSSTTSRYKDGERNVFEHLSNLAKKNNEKKMSSLSAMKPWIPNGKQSQSNNDDTINNNNNSKKSRDSKLMNDLYVYTNTKSITNTPINNYRYNNEYSFTQTIPTTTTSNNNNTNNEIIATSHRPSLSSTISPKAKFVKDKSRVALSGYLIDKTNDIETCRQGILLIARGSTSDELILAIRHQFSCNNISDVIVNFKNKVSESVISRSYSMDKLEAIPQIDENCDFIAYIGGTAIIESSASDEQSDYDYRGLRDRLSKKFHTFSIGSVIDEKNEFIPVITFHANQHSPNDDLGKINSAQTLISGNRKASSINQTSSISVSTSQAQNVKSSTSKVNSAPTISSSLKKTKSRNLSTSKKELVDSLLNSKQLETPTVQNLFPYSSIKVDTTSKSVNQISIIDDQNNNINADIIANNSNNGIYINPIPKIKFQLDLSSLLED